MPSFELLEALAEAAARGGQPPGAQDQQRDHEHEDQFKARSLA
jgi:hypothetical protein